MTYRELTMIDVREVLRRWAAGHSNRQIARETGSGRNTVVRYIEAAADVGVTREQAAALSYDVLHQVAQRVQARTLPARSEEWTSVAVHKERISQWLDVKRPLRR